MPPQSSGRLLGKGFVVAGTQSLRKAALTHHSPKAHEARGSRTVIVTETVAVAASVTVSVTVSVSARVPTGSRNPDAGPRPRTCAFLFLGLALSDNGAMADDLASVLRPLPWGCTGIPEVRVGHADDRVALTGCTVVLLPRASPYAAHASGGGVSTRQVSALVPHHAVPWADAVVVCGGSAYGLDAAGGVLAWLEERGRGMPVGTMRVPSVPAAAVFDLFVGDGRVRPDARMGRAACEAAQEEGVAEGRVGAGAGATVGKALGLARACWGGVGLAGVEVPGGAVVMALAVVNAFGNVHDPDSGRCVAGARNDDGTFADAEALVVRGALGARVRDLASSAAPAHTTVGVVVTGAALTVEECARAAVLASRAIPWCVRPSETAVDGDIVFFVSCGDGGGGDGQALGVAGRVALSRAIVRAVTGGGTGTPAAVGGER